MSGSPSTGLPSAFFLLPMALALFGVGVVAFASYQSGVARGHLSSLEKVRRECTKHEDRKFVALGNWLISGSGEVTVENVCVEWIVRR